MDRVRRGRARRVRARRGQGTEGAEIGGGRDRRGQG